MFETSNSCHYIHAFEPEVGILVIDHPVDLLGFVAWYGCWAIDEPETASLHKLHKYIVDDWEGPGKTRRR